MNNLKKALDNLNLKIKSLKYIKNACIVETDKGKLVYKENSNNYDIYEYLKTRDFNYFPRTLNDKNVSYDLLEFVNTNDVPKEQKISDLIHLSGILHRKTSFNKEIDMDEVKEIYENILKEVNFLMNYYSDLNNYIDTIVFMSPSEYLLVSNIDVIYYLLNFVKVEINNWYNYIKSKKVIRYSMIHNNLDLSHILESDRKYLISWSKSKLDMPINDLIKLYQDNYYDLDLEYFIREYEMENKIDEYEYLFFLIKLAIPKRIEFTKNTYDDCYKINEYLVYLKKIASLVQKYGRKYEKI
ncbi:MAG: hypothetical protein IJ501_06910 [Bacilli bacterium]|nr:hypothetical protein [Bacilli bacterium]